MVKISEIRKKMPTLFLRGEEVEKGMIVEIADAGEFIDKDSSGIGRPVFRIKIRLPNNEEKIWTMNKTTQENLAKAYGDDTANWVGKKVRLETSVYNIRGQIRFGIIGFPVTEEETDTLTKNLKEMLESIKKVGIKTVPKNEFNTFLSLKGIKIPVDEAIKKLNLKVVGDVVHIS